MRKLLTLISSLLVSFGVFADQSATITCIGDNIILQEKSPYWGENSEANQSLFILKAIDNDNESKATAFFLDISSDVDKNQQAYTSGSNSVGGSFELTTPLQWNEIGEGNEINEETFGTITYKHGHLTGKDERVKCTLN